MPIQCLSFVEYDETGWGWQLKKVHDPNWEEVASSIRRLDRFRYPWVWLFIGDDDEDCTADCLTVMGGGGVFWIALSSGKYDQLRLFASEKSSREVELWTSDQGFSDFEFHTTNDVEFVLRIARHFGETGEPLPEAEWEM